jgi:hypothetical protein
MRDYTRSDPAAVESDECGRCVKFWEGLGEICQRATTETRRLYETSQRAPASQDLALLGTADFASNH